MICVGQLRLLRLDPNSFWHGPCPHPVGVKFGSEGVEISLQDNSGCSLILDAMHFKIYIETLTDEPIWFQHLQLPFQAKQIPKEVKCFL